VETQILEMLRSDGPVITVVGIFIWYLARRDHALTLELREIRSVMQRLIELWNHDGR